MAGIGYDVNEIQALITSVKTVEGLINLRLDNIKALYKKLTSDAVFADCEYRDQLMELDKKLTVAAEEISKVLSAANQYIEEVSGAVNISVSNTVVSIAEQEALLEKALAEAAVAGDR